MHSAGHGARNSQSVGGIADVSAFDDLLTTGGEVGKQLFVWGVIYSVVNQVGQPYLRDLEQLINTHDPNVVLAPADLADAVVRKVRTAEEATAEAKKSGLTPSRFAELVHLAGEPPALQTVLELYRRGVIPWGEAGPTKATVANAIATSRIYTYWSDAIRKLNIVPIPTAVLVDAIVENQIPRGTRPKIVEAATGVTQPTLDAAATTFYEGMWANGFTPDQADVMVHTRGNPPAPSELVTLFRRGLIAWTGTGPTATTVQQGIFEGATKDKWEPIFKGLVRAYPTIYYVLQMLKNGSIDATTAATLLTKQGYTEKVVSGVVAAGIGTQVATDKKLGVSTITTLYFDQLITRTEALKLLTGIGYGDAAAGFVLAVQDMKREQTALNSAVAKVQSYYVARKIDASTAQAALTKLGVPVAATTQLLTTWELELASNVKLLTEAQLVGALKYTVLPLPTVLAGLQALGYSALDAWVVASVSVHAPLPTKPAPTGATLIGTI